MFPCEHCGHCLTSAHSLRLHMNRHLGLFRFRCPVCNKGFHQKLHLRGHMSSHDKALQSQCPGCDKAFAREDTMKRHALEQHGISLRVTQPYASFNRTPQDMNSPRGVESNASSRVDGDA